MFANKLSFKKGIAPAVVVSYLQVIYITCLPFHFSGGNAKTFKMEELAWNEQEDQTWEMNYYT